MSQYFINDSLVPSNNCDQWTWSFIQIVTNASQLCPTIAKSDRETDANKRKDISNLALKSLTYKPKNCKKSRGELSVVAVTRVDIP